MHIYTHTYIYIYFYKYMYIHTFIYTYKYINIYICIHTHTHTHTHTHIYIYIYRERESIIMSYCNFSQGSTLYPKMVSLAIDYYHVRTVGVMVNLKENELGEPNSNHGLG